MYRNIPNTSFKTLKVNNYIQVFTLFAKIELYKRLCSSKYILNLMEHHGNNLVFNQYGTFGFYLKRNLRNIRKIIIEFKIHTKTPSHSKIV